MVLAVIQARMGSTRLPGKVLLPILGKPLVWRIYERLAKSSLIDKIVIATTTEASDDPLEAFAKSQNIGIYRGSVDDIVARIYGAGEAFDATKLLRIWGDCPFVDLTCIDDGIKHAIEEDYDFVRTSTPTVRSIPGGLDFEIYKMSLLKDFLDKEKDPFYREFPADYVFKNEDIYRIKVVSYLSEFKDFYLTVDYPEDLELTKNIYEALYPQNDSFTFKEVIQFLIDNPEQLEGIKSLGRNIDYFEKVENKA